MEDRFSNIFFACCASWFKKNCFMNIFWPQQHGTELGVSANIFGNYDIAYREESCVTRSKQHNVWRRTTSIRTDLSTGRRTSTTWRRRRKKRFTRTCTYREYGLVCLKEMYFYDERRRVLSNFAHQGFCRALWALHPYFKKWPFAFCRLFPAKPLSGAYGYKV